MTRSDARSPDRARGEKNFNLMVISRCRRSSDGAWTSERRT